MRTPDHLHCPGSCLCLIAGNHLLVQTHAISLKPPERGALRPVPHPADSQSTEHLARSSSQGCLQNKPLVQVRKNNSIPLLPFHYSFFFRCPSDSSHLHRYTPSPSNQTGLLLIIIKGETKRYTFGASSHNFTLHLHKNSEGH